MNRVIAHVALVWFTLLSAFGLIFPFFSLYLKENAGLSGTEVGIALAVPPLMSILFQPVWGAFADKTGARTRLLAALAIAASAGSLCLYRAHGFLQIALATAFYSAFSVGIMSGLWSVSFALLAEQGPRAIGLVRVSGTIGFGAAVAVFPAILAALGSHAGELTALGGRARLESLFVFAAALLAAGALIAVALPRTHAVTVRAARGQLGTLLSNRPFLRLLAVAFFAFSFNQGPTALFPVLVRSYGGGVEAISRMWMFMLVLEVPLIAAFGFTVARLGVRRIIWLGVIAAAVRWLVSGLASDIFWVTLAQVLHGVTVWGLILGTSAFADRVVIAPLRSSAQAVLAMVSMGLGGILSNAISGVLIDEYGPTVPAIVAGCSSALLALMMPWMLSAESERTDANCPGIFR